MHLLIGRHTRWSATGSAVYGFVSLFCSNYSFIFLAEWGHFQFLELCHNNATCSVLALRRQWHNNNTFPQASDMPTRQSDWYYPSIAFSMCFALVLGESRSTQSHSLKWQEKMSKTLTIYFRTWVGWPLWYWFLCHQRSINVSCFSLKINHYMAPLLPFFCSFANQTQVIQVFRSSSSGKRDAKPSKKKKLWLTELEAF